MNHYEQPSSLDEQLREERRLAAAMRRRRLKRRLIPALLVALVIAGVIVLIVSMIPKKESAPVETEPPIEATATLVAGGDVRLDANMLASLSGPDGFSFTDCFSSLTSTVAAADISIVNVEGNFCGAPYGGGNASCPESLLTALHQCGFTVVQTANSYSIENGLSGLINTKHAIEAAGMDALGTFESQQERSESGGVLVKEVNGIRIALIGMTKGTNGLHLPEGAEYCVNLLYKDYDTTYSTIDWDGIGRLVDSAKSFSPDVIVCMMHWGSENTSDVSSAQEDVADYLFDRGVDVIIGSHSHLVCRMEGPTTQATEGSRDHGLVAYSLGDLLSTSDRDSMHAGCLLSLTFAKNGGRTWISDVQYLPTYSAYPSEEYEQDSYCVYDSLLAIRLYESSHYNHISKPLYEHLLETVEQVKERTECEYLGSK